MKKMIIILLILTSSLFAGLKYKYFDTEIEAIKYVIKLYPDIYTGIAPDAQWATHKIVAIPETIVNGKIKCKYLVYWKANY